MLSYNISASSRLVVHETCSCELVLFTAINEIKLPVIEKKQYKFFSPGFVVDKKLLSISACNSFSLCMRVVIQNRELRLIQVNMIIITHYN